MHLFTLVTTLRTKFKKICPNKTYFYSCCIILHGICLPQGCFRSFSPRCGWCTGKGRSENRIPLPFRMHYNFLFFHTWFKSNYFNCQMELSTKHELEEKSHIQMSICMPRFPRQIGKLPTCYRQRRDLFGEGMAEQSQRSQCLE